MAFYEILQEIMAEKEMNIPDVARSCGLSDSTVRSMLDRKAKNISLEVAFNMQRGLGVSLERLNGLSEKPASVTEGGLDTPLDVQLAEFIRQLSPDQKEFLLAQLKIMQEKQ